jgi:exopolysaccharide biosynthesis polyprenyl glycosylphosphotransferase
MMATRTSYLRDDADLAATACQIGRPAPAPAEAPSIAAYVEPSLPDDSPIRAPRRVRIATAAALTGSDAAAAGAALFAVGVSDRSVAWAATALVLLLACSPIRTRCHLSALHEAPRHLAGLGVAFVAAVAVLRSGTERTDLIHQVLLTAALAITFRAISYFILRVKRSSGLSERAIVVGSGRIGVGVACTLSAHPEYGLDVVGLVDDAAPLDDGLPLLGALADLPHLVRREQVSRLVVAFGPTQESTLVPVVRQIAAMGVEIDVVPRFFELGIGQASDDFVWGLPLRRLPSMRSRGAARLLKRAIDVVVSGALLIVMSPALAACAVAVKLDSPGPALFRQRRIGKHGQPFDLLKFRSMIVNNDSDETWSVLQDRRVTRIGRVLRATSFDELPQLWNVLRGDMSLVGPRPERPHFVDQFTAEIPGYTDRHRVTVGLTGWAQIHGLRGPTSIEDRARFDNYYIEHWSIWHDIVILASTAGSVVRDFLRTGGGVKRQGTDADAASATTGIERRPGMARFVIDLRPGPVPEVELAPIDGIAASAD